MWTFARGSENVLITSETTGWKLQPVVSLRVITTNVSNNEIMTIMNIEIVTYPLVKKCKANQF